MEGGVNPVRGGVRRSNTWRAHEANEGGHVNRFDWHYVWFITAREVLLRHRESVALAEEPRDMFGMVEEQRLTKCVRCARTGWEAWVALRAEEGWGVVRKGRLQKRDCAKVEG